MTSVCLECGRDPHLKGLDFGCQREKWTRGMLYEKKKIPLKKELITLKTDGIGIFYLWIKKNLIHSIGKSPISTE